MKIWVIYADMGYDGNSPPFRAFSTKEAAIAYCYADENDYDDNERENEEYCPLDWEELEVCC